MIKALAAKIGAMFYALWGLIHILGGVVLIQQAQSGGAGAALATLGTAVPPEQLRQVTGGVAQAVLAFFGWNWVWIGLLVLVVAVRLNWRASPAGYWINLFVAGASDLGLVLLLLVPGYMAIADGWPGPLLWLLAAGFSTLGLLSQGARRVREAAPA